MILARALYKEAKMLILDEPTAALDAIAESEMYKMVNDLVGDHTHYLFPIVCPPPSSAIGFCFLRTG